MGLALFDTLLLLGTYNTLFLQRFDRWAGITGSIVGLALLWVGTSYLLGRYSKPDQGQRDSQRRRLGATAVVALLVLAVVVVGLNWGLKVEDPRTFRNFVLPLLAAVTLASGTAQLLVTRLLSRRQAWLLVGEAAELTVVQRELERDGGQNLLDLHYCDCRALEPSFETILLAVDGIAVSEAAELNDALLQRLLARRERGASVCSLVIWAEHHLQRVPPELFSSRWLLQADGFELQPNRWGWRLKRMGDLIVASLLLILTAPVLLVSALAIRLEGGRGILYRQVRTGLYGEAIEVWKLRTMCEEAEARGARWASRNDPRITRVGALLRRLRIDELPQLIAVLKGEMSLIGPRPERPEIEATLEQQIQHYRVRHWVRPGLSGWAQVCYPYGASIEDSRMKLSYDLYYLRNASLMLDTLILIKTIRLLARARGAQPVVHHRATMARLKTLH
ncbi:exopolysaccharide biosynthesis polyprenyl glycosylphosphotransferase [Aphanothece cf. minutissima CCALA 015]|uniref:Exopolysaccharide biosynthesis polyprenyl glycosylphosphotransferase n=1 Tax=Aphanothece cf. minutissima CCALA 015 TaxID=2107695 RepID=A0ABX5F634_9CHRO|nr:exopolysaccharide biosynthesis polyprenyl glycosylphosphotransferase [Aphanothece cf. minutissima CCALA 015]